MTMIRSRLAHLLSSVVLAAAVQAHAATPALDAVLSKMTATPEQARQVADAIHASPGLAGRFEQMAAAGQFTGIRIVAPEALRKPPFSAYLDGTEIVIVAPMLADLARPRLFDVVHPDDVLPNNTTFVLAHLAYHLRTTSALLGIENRFHQQVAELAKQPGTHDYTAIMQDDLQAKLTNEAAALIEAWDTTADAAAHTNPSFRPQQFGAFFMNFRYRGLFYKAMTGPQKLVIGDGAMIAPDAANLQVLVKALGSSKVLDVE